MSDPKDRQHIVDVVRHPSAQVFLTRCRDITTDTEEFADLMRRIGYVLACQVLTRLKTKPRAVTTPLYEIADGAEFDGRVALVPVMRAGDILQEGFRTFLNNPLVWHISLARDEATLATNVYGVKVPTRVPAGLQKVIVLEVMLATGGSAVTAIDILKERGAKDIVFVCVVAAPEGIGRLKDAHPDVEIYTVAIDTRLTHEGEKFPPGYIVPGLGDAGDRSFPQE